MDAAYRDDAEALRARRDALAESQRTQVARLSSFREAYASRLASLAAFGIAAAGGFVLGLVDLALERQVGRVTLVAIAAGLVGVWVSKRRLRKGIEQRMASFHATTGDIQDDLERIEQADPMAWARERLRETEPLAIVLPVLGATLLALGMLLHARLELLGPFPVEPAFVLQGDHSTSLPPARSLLLWRQTAGFYLAAFVVLFAIDLRRFARRVREDRDDEKDQTASILRWFAGPVLGVSFGTLLEGIIPTRFDGGALVYYAWIGAGWFALYWVLPRVLRRRTSRARELRHSIANAPL